MKTKEIVLLYQTLCERAKVLAKREMDKRLTDNPDTAYTVAPFEDFAMMVRASLEIEGKVLVQKVPVSFLELDTIRV